MAHEHLGFSNVQRSDHRCLVLPGVCAPQARGFTRALGNCLAYPVDRRAWASFLPSFPSKLCQCLLRRRTLEGIPHAFVGISPDPRIVPVRTHVLSHRRILQRPRSQCFGALIEIARAKLASTWKDAKII